MKFNGNKILISGTSSGLGRYLFDHIPSTKYDRKKKYNYYNKKQWELIIHCASYSGNDILETAESIKHSFILSNLKAKKFIYISSTIIYEFYDKNNHKLPIYNQKNISLYCKSKIISEKFFSSEKSLILRMGSIIGPNMRKNTIYKLLFESNKKINLSSKSLYSFIDYEEVKDFILFSQSNKLFGIYNFLRNDYITLKNISKHFKKKNKFGNINFYCTKASNKKIKKYVDLTSNSSLDILNKYYKENAN